MRDKRDKATMRMFSAGRPRIYANDAEKMRAYRKRVKEKSVTILSEKSENLDNFVTVKDNSDIV